MFQLLGNPQAVLRDIRRSLATGGELFAGPITIEEPTDEINRVYWFGSSNGRGPGNRRHLVAGAERAGFTKHYVFEGDRRSRVTTPNQEADRLDTLWGKQLAFSDNLRSLPEPDEPVEMDMTIRAVVLVN